MPARVQRTRPRVKGLPGMPEGAVYVGRPTPFGNPFAYHGEGGLVRYGPQHLERFGRAWDHEGRISGAGTRHDLWFSADDIVETYVRWATRAEVVDLYRRALVTPTPQLRLYHRSRSWTLGRDGQPLGFMVTVDLVREQLAGRDLACWCHPGDPCHVDVLLEVANG